MASEPLKLRVLNVGQGSCILLELPGNRWGLIDCYKRHSGKPEVLTLVDGLERNLEFIVLTHPHEDHLLGTADVIEAVHGAGHDKWNLYESPFQLWQVEAISRSLGKSSADLLREINRINSLVPKARRIPLKKSDSDWIADGLWCEVLAPTNERYQALGERSRVAANKRFPKRGVVEQAPDIDFKYNEVSLGILLIYAPSLPRKARSRPEAGARILIGGDVIEEAWKELARSGDLEPVDVAIAPHHGGTGNPAELWDGIAHKTRGGPYAIISCGSHGDPRNGSREKNGYAHPHHETLMNMRKVEANIHCTNLGWQCTDMEIVSAVRSRRSLAARKGVSHIDEMNEAHAGIISGPRSNDVHIAAHAENTDSHDLECSDDIYLLIGEDGQVSPIFPEIGCAWVETKGKSSR